MAIATFNRGQARAQFGGLFSDVFASLSTGVDIASLIDAAGATQTIAVPGVRLGDMVIGMGWSIDLAGITVTAYVSASDVVSMRVQNESGGTVDLAPATVTLLIGRPDPNHFRASLS